MRGVVDAGMDEVGCGRYERGEGPWFSLGTEVLFEGWVDVSVSMRRRKI